MAQQTIRRGYRPPLLALQFGADARTRGLPLPAQQGPAHFCARAAVSAAPAYDPGPPNADVELGATEQKFNLLVHREIQREYGLPGQTILTMPILVGLDGKRKMSKSLGNYVGITEPPADIFGKLMSIPDDLMWSYYELATDRAPAEIAALRQQVAAGSLHPMDAKMKLAEEVVSTFHGAAAAQAAAGNFKRVFRDRQAPEQFQELRVKKLGDKFISISQQRGNTSELSGPHEI